MVKPIVSAVRTTLQRVSQEQMFVRREPTFISESRELNTLEMLLPVTMDASEYDKFCATFHARGRNKSKPFLELAAHLCYSSLYLNSILVGLRRAYRLLPSWEADGVDIGAKIAEAITEYHNYVTSGAKDTDTQGQVEAPVKGKRKAAAPAALAASAILPKSVIVDASQFVNRMCSGRHSIIRDSAKYKDGKDIIYSGLRGASSTSLAFAHTTNSDSQKVMGIPADDDGTSDRVKHLRSLICELCKAFVVALTGNALDHPVASYDRSVKQHAPNYLGELLVEVFNKSALAKTLRLHAPKFISTVDAAASNYLKDYFSAIAVFEPNTDVVRSRIAFNGPDDTFPVNLAHSALMASVGFSFAINLPKHFVSYICQAKEGERPSLAALNTWSVTWSAAALRQRNEATGGLKPSNIPRYVLMPSKAAYVSQKRKELGLFVEPGRCNEDGIFIDGRGDLNFLPKSEDLTPENSKEYEEAIEKALALSFEAGTPLAASQSGVTDSLFALAHPEYGKTIAAVKKKLHDCAGSIQAYNWDLNAVITVSESDPDRVVATRLTGASIPTELNLAAYMRSDFSRAFRHMFSRSMLIDEDGEQTRLSTMTDKRGVLFEQSSVLFNICNTYSLLLRKKLVPSYTELVEQARKSLNIHNLEDEAVRPFEQNARNPKNSIYPPLLMDLTLSNEAFTSDENIATVLRNTITPALVDARALLGSNLAKFCAVNDIEPTEHERFFGKGAAAHEFSNVFNYFGGRIFYHAMKAILAVDVKTIQKVSAAPEGEIRVPWVSIMREVIPFARMFASYVTDKKEEIFKKADEIIESNKNPKKSEADLKIPGSKEPIGGQAGMMLFPHQAEDLCILANHPKIVVLDVAPGGGKCLVGDSLVPTGEGLLTLKELRDLSGGSDADGNFSEIRVRVTSHERKPAYTDATFSTKGVTRRVVMADGTLVKGLPEHKLWALDASSTVPEFVRLDELTKNHWIQKSIGDALYASKTPTICVGGKTQRMSEDLAEALGWLVAEGYSTDNYRVCTFTQHDPEMLDLFVQSMSAVFGNDSLRMSPNGLGAVLKGEALKTIRSLISLGTSAFKEVPRIIRTSPKIYQAAFLRALFEGDGSVYHKSSGAGKKKVWLIEYSTISPILARQVKVMLENMGVHVSLSVGSAYTSNNHDHKKRVHKLYVNWRHLAAFKEHIGFISFRKSELLDKAVAHTSWVETEAQQSTNMASGGIFNRLPAYEAVTRLRDLVVASLDKFTYEVPKTSTGAGGRTETWSLQKVLRDAGMSRKSMPAKYDGGATNRSSVLRILRIVDSLESEIQKDLLSSSEARNLLTFLKTVLNQTWVQVRTNRKSTKSTVYDLSVPGPHSYSVNGLYSHNTITLLSDIAMIYNDNLVKGPLFIICPNGLVGNWIEDMHKITCGRWNMIPVTTETYSSWGDERLTDMIKKAPRNTIVVVGNSFLSNTPKQQLVIGNAVEAISNAVEFVKKFAPEYLAIDESHRCRNQASGLHKAVKTIMTMSSLKFGRIATGTLIQNVMSDVVGQSALFSAQMFRSVDDFNEENKVAVDDGLGGTIMDYGADVPSRIRSHLSEFATVLTHKRKDWAFMLPLPLETFIRVHLEDDSGSTEDVLGHAHRMFYDAVLRKTMDELRSNPLIKKLAGEAAGNGNGDDEEGDDDGKENVGEKDGKLVTTGGTSVDVVTEGDDDSDNLDALETALKPYLQRLEMILTDPLGDPELLSAAQAFFGTNVKRETFVSAKIRKAVDRIKFHFAPIPFRKGAKYKSSDMCDYDGKSYILRPSERVGQTEVTAVKTPDEDTENWLLQDRGKVIVFCRYTRTVDSLYRALPGDLKSKAVVFHGEVAGNKWENLDKFKNDPKCQILIANEMGISEGHNLQCFPGHVNVLVDYDKAMPIQDVYENPEITHILSYNLETRKIERQKITKKMRHRVDSDDVFMNVRVSDNKTGKRQNLLLTHDHPIFLKNGDHIGACYLQKGDQLITYGGQFSTFRSTDSGEIVPKRAFGGSQAKCYLTVERVFRYSGKGAGEYKYDLNVQGNHNFFACAGEAQRHKSSPMVPVLVHNCASRFIRLECPWAPGELDQSSARIFRPDVDGRFHRQLIFLDWIITDGTLEVAKMGRLISKMLKKTQFDELYNPTYYKNLNPRNLPIIRMSLDNIEQLNSLEDLCSIGGDGGMGDVHPDSYIGQYNYLIQETAAEFREMKKTRRSSMISVAPTKMPDDASVIRFTPWTPNLKVPDRDGDGLIALNAIMREEDDPFTKAVKRDPRVIIDKYVRTEFGLGRVVGFTSKRNGEDDDDSDYAGFSKLRVDLAQGGQVLVGASRVHIATNITDRTAKKWVSSAPKISEKDEERSKGRSERAERSSERSSRRQERIDRGAKDVASGRKSRREKEQADELDTAVQLELYPVVYNGALVLEAVLPEGSEDALKSYGWKDFGNYAFFKIVNEHQYNDVLDWIEATFTLDRKTEQRLEQMLDGFQTGRGRKFDVAIAPLAEIKQFFLTAHRVTKVVNRKKPDIRVYPLVIHSSFYLVVDLDTNPVFRKYIGKTIPNCSPTTKIQEADGLNIKFFRTKSELMSEARALRSAGFEIVNYDSMKEEVKALDLKQYT